MKPVYSIHLWAMKKWLDLFGGQNEWGKAIMGLTEMAFKFMERWPSCRVATIDHYVLCHFCVPLLSLLDPLFHFVPFCKIASTKH